MKKISVIIVTYNSQNIIEKCIKNLFLYNDINDALEVIIVDNSSDEVGNAMFKKLEDIFPKQLRLIKNKKNGGYGQGNNLGIQYASAPIVSIMNPDVILVEPLFISALTHYQTNTNLGLLGYKQKGGHNLSFYFRLEFCFPFLIGYLTKFLNKIDFFSEKMMFLSGAFFFAAKKEFEIIDLFDENIFLYGEESDITKRILNKKLNIIYDKSKTYLHEIDQRLEMSDVAYKIFIESSIYYFRKFSFNKYLFLYTLMFELKSKLMISKFAGNNTKSKEVYEKLKIVLSFID